MSEVFFISDTHFGHKNIIQFEPMHRPFKTIGEHDAELIRRWNSVVTPKDMVYHLGDFAFSKKALEYAAQLNGKKILIMGNHDCYCAEDYLKYFHRLFGMIFYKECILSHIPVHPHDLGSRWFLNVHGHLHANNVMKKKEITFYKNETGDNIINGWPWERKIDPNYFNVSCEQINLTPINYDEIKKRVAELR